MTFGPMFLLCSRMDRIALTPEKLAETLTIWIRIAPRHLWRNMAEQTERERKAPGTEPFGRFDPRKAMAEYLAGKFAVARWEVTFKAPENR